MAQKHGKRAVIFFHLCMLPPPKTPGRNTKLGTYLRWSPWKCVIFGFTQCWSMLVSQEKNPDATWQGTNSKQMEFGRTFAMVGVWGECALNIVLTAVRRCLSGDVGTNIVLNTVRKCLSGSVGTFHSRHLLPLQVVHVCPICSPKNEKVQFQQHLIILI